MKILQISKYQYPYIGGVEQTSIDIVDALNSMDNIEQKIICFNEDAEGGGIVCHRRETVHDNIDGVEVIRCGCIAKVASQSISLTYYKELKKIMNVFEPDVVILHYPNPFVSSFLLALLKKGVKFVLYWHLDITKQKILGKFFYSQNINLLKRADKIVATSPNYIQGSPYLTKFKEKCVVIPSCIRVERLELTDISIRKASYIKRKNEGKTLVFSIGRHVPYKGMIYLVKASEYLNDNFKVFIGGSGELTEALKKEAEGNDKIVFLGRISNDDLKAYYKACDIFAFPSITKNEAFGLALAEAMYFEKPVVTFNIPGSGVNYVSLDNVTGIECQNGNVEDYAQAIKKLAVDKKLALEYGKKAKIRVVENFMFNSFKKRINSLVSDLSKQ